MELSDDDELALAAFGVGGVDAMIVAAWCVVLDDD